MDEKCGVATFDPKRKGLVPTGPCGLMKGHAGPHLSQVETKSEAERMSTKQLDLDLNDAWKPSRDVGEEDIPLYGIADEI